MTFENLAHVAPANGSTMPAPDAGTDYLGADHVAAFRASAAITAARAFYAGVPRGPVTFGDEQPVPTDSTPADRLAAYLGRNLTGTIRA
ncbi:hypothetical protein [Pseudonocardia sp. H11422]|uniref:hypothetical protein n=1 Tax=Pseudonocardia sp. H11422 TaxID=2835866 RepID=UPI001BDC7940|nr:hypothetical protein [Pseudonocardia sp. H11422]